MVSLANRNEAPACTQHSTQHKIVIPKEKLVQGKIERSDSNWQ
jgi:hypothetical protein